MTNFKQRLQSVHHLLIGFYLAAEGCEELTNHYYLAGGIIGLSGLMILGYFTYIIRTRGEHHTLDLLASFSEAAALLFTSYIYIIEGRHYIQYVTLAAGIAYLIAAAVRIVKRKRHGQKSSRPAA